MESVAKCNKMNTEKEAENPMSQSHPHLTLKAASFSAFVPHEEQFGAEFKSLTFHHRVIGDRIQ